MRIVPRPWDLYFDDFCENWHADLDSQVGETQKKRTKKRAKNNHSTSRREKREEKREKKEERRKKREEKQEKREERRDNSKIGYTSGQKSLEFENWLHFWLKKY